MNFSSEVNLIGVCEKYNEMPNGLIRLQSGEFFDIQKKNLLGLKEFHIVNILPFSGDTLYFVLIFSKEIKESDTGNKRKILLQDLHGKVLGTIEFEITVYGDKNTESNNKFHLQAVQIPYLFSEPGEYQLFIDNGKDKNLVGKFFVVYQPAIPLTQERIQAIKSDPLSMKYLRYAIGCNSCREELNVLCGIEKDKNKKKSNSVWYQDLPESFKCKCGKVDINLKYLKESAHALLGYRARNFSSNTEMIEGEYSKGVLESIARKFSVLIDNLESGEEEIQKFIEKNPIILSCLTPDLLKYKSPIGSKFKTDFTVFTPKKELLLVEIEKPSTKLFKKNGDQHAELTHAFDQVKNWLMAATRNRLALIDDVKMEGLTVDTVTNIKGVVIAGKNNKEYDPYLEKLRTSDIDFYTYDDLLNNLLIYIKNFNNI